MTLGTQVVIRAVDTLFAGTNDCLVASIAGGIVRHRASRTRIERKRSSRSSSRLQRRDGRFFDRDGSATRVDSCGTRMRDLGKRMRSGMEFSAEVNAEAAEKFVDQSSRKSKQRSSSLHSLAQVVVAASSALETRTRDRFPVRTRLNSQY